jgi:MFS transporter, DHA1 family, inner membrane transport protein
MTTQRAALSRGRPNLALAALFLGTFALGSAELLVVGVLNVIADEFAISIPAAGWLVTAYALGIAVGGPVLTALTIPLNRKTILVGAIALYAVANVIPVLIPNYGLFVAVRAITGSLQGLFIGVAFVMGMSIVPPERAGRAISTIVSGVAVSAAIGTPLGTLLGQSLGWQGSFLAIVGFAVVALFGTVALVPQVASTGTGAAGQAKYAFAPRVLAVLGLTFLVFASLYTALTYIVSFLQDVTGVTGALVSVFLFAYGLAIAVGTFSGGRFADQNAARTLIVATAGTAVSLLALYLAGSSPVLVALLLLIWGLFGSVMVPSLQLRVVTLAGPGDQLASALPASSANVGIALAAVLGGVALGFSPSGPVITGLFIALIGIAVAWATSFLKPPVAEQVSESAEASESDAEAA